MIGAIEKRIKMQHRSSEASQRVEAIPGIGVIGATAIVATVADPTIFRSGRDFAAWIGLVPRQDSTGGKQKLGPISKQGDRYCGASRRRGDRCVAARPAESREVSLAHGSVQGLLEVISAATRGASIATRWRLAAGIGVERAPDTADNSTGGIMSELRRYPAIETRGRRRFPLRSVEHSPHDPLELVLDEFREHPLAEHLP